MRKANTYDINNPLFQFYEQLVETNKGKYLNNWNLLSELTGLPVQTLISVARKDQEGILNMTLKTYLTIKETIDVDMLSFGKA